MAKKNGNVTYCKSCPNGGEIKNFLVKCRVDNSWNHSIVNCRKIADGNLTPVPTGNRK